MSHITSTVDFVCRTLPHYCVYIFTYPSPPQLSFNPNRYNPEHLKTIEDYVEEQVKENTYDLEANLAVLKLYQFNPNLLNLRVSHLILLKALTNFPHTDFTLCKCLLLPAQMQDDTIQDIIFLADILEKCDFELFWSKIHSTPDLVVNIAGFFDSIRRYVCHVVGITFQTIRRDYLAALLGDIDGNIFNFIVYTCHIFICVQFCASQIMC